MLRNSSKGWLYRLTQYQHCVLCKQFSNDILCDICHNDIAAYDLANCEHNLLNNNKIVLGLKAKEFDQLIAAAEYSWPLSKFISELKFSGKFNHAKVLADFFYTKLTAPVAPPSHCVPQALIPLPLHQKRLAQRQYNQAVAIAKRVAKHCRVPCLTEVLERTKNTQAQSQLSGAERINNARSAFELKQVITLQHVALFDDVITTGATISAAANCLRSAYPNMKIDAWAVCITPEY